MNFSFTTDGFIQAAWIAGVVALAVTILLSLQVLVMRQRNLMRELRRQHLFTSWRPLLYEAVIGGAPALWSVARRDEGSFLLLWLQLQDGLRGEPRQRLNALAEKLGADEMARRRLRKDAVLGRVLAICTLGYLGRERDYAEVTEHLDEPRIYLSLAAARALVLIDPRRAPEEIIPRLGRRHDWPISLFATVLAETDRDTLSKSFLMVQQDLPPADLIRMLPLASILTDDTAERVLKRLLATSDDHEIVSAALKQVRSPSLLEYVRLACAHEEWAVRTQAAAALGRVGELVDRQHLLRLLSDRQWWVRYRAAQALLSGRFGAPQEVTELVGKLGDRFAVDILEHALAERRT